MPTVLPAYFSLLSVGLALLAAAVLALWSRANDVGSLSLFLLSSIPLALLGPFVAYWASPEQFAHIRGFSLVVFGQLAAAVAAFCFVVLMSLGALVTLTKPRRFSGLIAISAIGYVLLVSYGLSSLLFLLGE